MVTPAEEGASLTVESGRWYAATHRRPGCRVGEFRRVRFCLAASGTLYIAFEPEKGWGRDTAREDVDLSTARTKGGSFVVRRSAGGGPGPRAHLVFDDVRPA